MSATATNGIFQGDVVIRSAILAAIKDIRDVNPWLLDYAFFGLQQDDLTSGDYGPKQIAEAKRWFMKTDIPVFHNINTQPAKFPSITISQLGSSETDVTLGDVHHDPYEDLDTDPPVIGPFVPKAYDYTTGIMTLPDEVAANSIVVPGMAVVGADGKTRYAITVVDDDNPALITLSPGIQADFSKSTLHYAMPVYKVQLESVVEKEDYLIGIHLDEPSRVPILYSIMKLILYRYKQALLEARGFEKSTFTSTDMTKIQQIEPEFGYARYFTLTGYVRQYWAKNITQTIQKVDTVLQIQDGAHLPPDTNPAEQLWIGDEDSLSGAAT